MNSRDFTVAALPLASTLTLGQWNSIMGIIGTTVATAYIIWKWHRQIRK